MDQSWIRPGSDHCRIGCCRFRVQVRADYRAHGGGAGVADRFFSYSWRILTTIHPEKVSPPCKRRPVLGMAHKLEDGTKL
jgi:hypothetical protein